MKGFKNEKKEFIPTEPSKKVGSDSVNQSTEVESTSFEKQGKSLVMAEPEQKKRIKDSLPEYQSPEWNKLKADVENRFDHDFNSVNFENIKKVDDNWFESVITVEPSQRDIKDYFGDSGLSDKEFEKEHDEDEIEEAKDELRREQEEIMWGTVFEAKDSMLAEKIIENQEEIISDLGLRIIDVRNTNAEEYYTTGVFLGVNGAGYDFYENHWVPLYRLFGWV